MTSYEAVKHGSRISVRAYLLIFVSGVGGGTTMSVFIKCDSKEEVEKVRH